VAWFLGRVRSDRTGAVLLVVPSIVAIGIFVYGFIGWTGYVSLSRWRGLIPDYHFVGADNYDSLSKNPRFQADMRNTIVFTALFLLSATVVGFLAAALLDQKIKAEAFFRGVFLFPMAISFVTDFNDLVFSFVTGRDTAAATSAIQQACVDNACARRTA
jgi:glucose/mannose transport system permease protein